MLKHLGPEPKKPRKPNFWYLEFFRHSKLYRYKEDSFLFDYHKYNKAVEKRRLITKKT